MEAAGTEVAAAFTVADFARTGWVFSVHTSTVTILHILVMDTKAVAIWSCGESSLATAGAAVASKSVTDSLD